MLNSLDENRHSEWIAYHRPLPQAKLRLFCFPFAGGAASTYQTWQNGLPLSVEVWPVQLPGRETRLGEPFFDRLAPLLEALAGALGPFLDMPYAFFGHSLGALIAFELARYLRRLNAPGPSRLVVSGRSAPHLPLAEPVVHVMPDDELKAYLLRLNGTPREVLDEPELWELISPFIRADFAINETYEYAPEAPLECPIIAFGGVRDWLAGPSEIEAWRMHTRNQFTMRMFVGDHFFIGSARSNVLAALTQALV